MKIGIYLSHPFYDQSFANKFIVDHLLTSTDSVLRHIDTLDPINLEEEQQFLQQIDTLILQFPIFWYNYPASMKKWLDSALTLWLKESKDSIQGKNLIISTTTGAPAESYSHNGYNTHSIQTYLCGLKQIAYFTGMNYRGIIVTYGVKDVHLQQKYLEQKLTEHLHAIKLLIQQSIAFHY
ncbi:MAG: NAD(P)H-dependent oxidoreductase [Brevinema sp.]